jgi:hypothetical protein
VWAGSWVSRPGHTRNPWDPTRTPGGSSGGEAVALATGMTPLGLGNDLGGSLRVPSQMCGTTAIKPSRGRVAEGAVTEPAAQPLLNPDDHGRGADGPPRGASDATRRLNARGFLTCGGRIRHLATIPVSMMGDKTGTTLRSALSVRFTDMGSRDSPLSKTAKGGAGSMARRRQGVRG